MKPFKKFLGRCLSCLYVCLFYHSKFVFSFTEKENEASQKVTYWVIVCLVSACLSSALQRRKMKLLKK